MSDLFEINNAVPSFAVFGNPVVHSQSPTIHQLFAKQFGIELEYQAIEIPSEQFGQSVKDFCSAGGVGLNITIPFKEQAFRLCDTLTERAQFANSVNTIWFDDKQSICGDTTDGIGLIRDLQNNDVSIKDKSVLLLGAGGSVKAVLEPLLKQQPLKLQIANRTVSRAVELAKQCETIANVEVSAYQELKGHSFDIVINGTSLSLQKTLPPLPDSLLNQNACCYDFMYSKVKTVFMQWALAQGALIVLDGKGMLVEQAAEGFSIWHGQKPDTRPVIDYLANDS